MPEIKAKCPGDVTECDWKCWNWYKTHTYKPISDLKQPWSVPTPVWFITEIRGILNGGPSEKNQDIPIALEVKEYPSNKWVTISTYDVMANIETMTPFKAQINKRITQFRFKAINNNEYVDLSECTLDGAPLGIVKMVLDSVGVETRSGGFLQFDKIDGISPGEGFKIKATLKNVGDPGTYRIELGGNVTSQGSIGRDETVDITWPGDDWRIMGSSVGFQEKMKIYSMDSVNDKWNTSTNDIGVPLNISQRLIIRDSGIMRGGRRTWDTIIPGGIPTYAKAIVKNDGNVPTSGKVVINGVNYSVTNLSPGGIKEIIHSFSAQNDRSMFVKMKAFTLVTGGEKLTSELTKSLFVKQPRINISINKIFFQNPVEMFNIPFSIELVNHDDYQDFGKYPKVRVTAGLINDKTTYIQFSETKRKVNLTTPATFTFTEGLNGSIIVDSKNILAKSDFKVLPKDACFIFDDINPGVVRNCRARIQTFSGNDSIDINGIGLTKTIFTNSEKGGLNSDESDQNGIGVYKPKTTSGVIEPLKNLGYIYDQAMAFGIEFSRDITVVFPKTGKYFRANKIKWIGGRIKYSSHQKQEQESDEKSTEAMKQYSEGRIFY